MNLFGIIGGRVNYKVNCVKTNEIIDKVRKNATVRQIIVKDDNFVEFCVAYKDRKVVDKILKEACVECLERRGSGFVHFLYGYRKRAGLITGILMTAFLLVYMLQFIWDIRVEGNEKVSDLEIIELLEKNGFYKGIRKKNADIERAVNMLLVEEDRISWAAINFEGTVAHVEIKEAKIFKKEDKKENVNLVASHDGIIVRADALSGSSSVTKGDTVTKGQLLVSAFVEKRTGGYLLKGARGNVWAQTKRSYIVTVPLEYNEKRYTGNSKTSYTLSFLGRDIGINNLFDSRYERSDSYEDCGNLNLFGRIVLPIEMKKQTVSEYVSCKVKRTENEALKTAKEMATERLKADSPDFVLADISESYTVEDVLVYECTFEGVENIAVPLEFDVS